MFNVKIKNFNVRYPFRDLKNYKKMHEATARKKGVFDAFMAARTLTAARSILFG